MSDLCHWHRRLHRDKSARPCVFRQPHDCHLSRSWYGSCCADDMASIPALIRFSFFLSTVALVACRESEEQCSEPFFAGECDAAMPVYWHNSATGECELRTYGGCGGNDNRFTTLEECQSTCDAASSGPSCEVGGVVYPHGSTNVPDPGSCNTCTCSAGEVTGCTKIYCPIECEEGSIYGTDCTDCGPVDECLTVRTGCLPACQTEGGCEESGGYCIDGACRNICA